MHCVSSDSLSFNVSAEAYLRVRTLAAVCMLALLASCSRSKREVASSRLRACPSSTVLVLGACVTPDVAQAVCGPSSIPLAGGCVPRPPCKAGEAREANGSCIAAARVRALAEENGILLGDEDDVGCDGAQELVLRDASGHLGCRPPPTAMRACPIGSVGDEAQASCVRIKDGDLVDASAWLRAVVGPSGGKGSRATCGLVDEGELEVSLRFLDNDVRELELRAHPLSAEFALRPFANAMRALGGAARTSEVATRVRCPPGSNGRPRGVQKEPR